MDGSSFSNGDGDKVIDWTFVSKYFDKGVVLIGFFVDGGGG